MKEQHHESEEEKEVSATPAVVEKCQVCLKNPFKYKCPRCAVKSCSLTCVNSHKSATKCTGIPDKVAFVDMKTFNVQQLKKDTSYLTDVIDAVNRNSKKYAYNYVQQKIEGRLKQLRKICKDKRGCFLRIGPTIFAASQKNKSFYKRQENSIYWTTGYNFIKEGVKFNRPPSVITHYIEEPISEKTKIKDVLVRFEDKTKYLGTELNEMLSKCDKTAFGYARVFVKSAVKDKKEVRYREIEHERTIEEAMKGEEICDFPIFYIAFRDVDISQLKLNLKDN